MSMILAIVCYILISFFSYCIVVQRYKRMQLYYQAYGAENYDSNKKMTIVMIFTIAIMFVLYNIMVTNLNSGVSGDRSNYALNFYGYRVSSSAGLTFVINFIKRLTSNIRWLFYVSTFVPVILTLFAYRISKEALPSSILFLLTTQYFLFTLAGLKQSYANGFAVLCIAFALRNNGWKDISCSILMVIASIWFHHTGYFLIPIFVLLRLKKSKEIYILFFVAMTLIVVFLDPILLRIASSETLIAPVVTRKINEYFGETAIEELQTEGSLTFIKGIPFYIITIVGWVKRRQLLKKISNYDNYLLLSFMLSLVYLATLYNAWVYRLSYFLYFPAAVFFGQLMHNVRNRNNYSIIGASVIGLNALVTLRFITLVYMNYGGF